MNGQEQRYAQWGGAEPEDRLAAVECDEELMSVISPLNEPLEQGRFESIAVYANAGVDQQRA